MAQVMTPVVGKPAWVDLSTSDPQGSRDFYAKLFGWRVEVNDDPQYGGYALAKIGDDDAAGIGPSMDPKAPTAWNLYIGTNDADDLARRVEAAGGMVIAQPFDVGDQGKMAVFRDPVGAFISTWQPSAMRGFRTEGANAFGWAELNARGRDNALAFYDEVFGWSAKSSDMGEGQASYVEFQVDGESVAGAAELPPNAGPEVPNHWLVYFRVDDVDATYRQALDLGAREMNAPSDFPGGRFAILVDPQGAVFALLRMTRR
jgi:uncharacterized protein